MPAALVESLALSHPTELGLLDDAGGSERSSPTPTSGGIAAWLANRPLGLRFDPVASPSTARVGRTTTIQVRVTNNGTAEIPAGTALVVGPSRAGARTTARPAPGRRSDAPTLPRATAPGRERGGEIRVRPIAAGAALWKVDAVVGGIRTSTRRVPFLQLPVTVRR